MADEAIQGAAAMAGTSAAADAAGPVLAGAAPAAAIGASGGRMFHLDALRAFAMFFGVFVHGSAIDYNPDLLFETVREASDLFRMATFFLIGGFFTVMVYQRAKGGDYMRSRVQLLVVPLLASLIIVVPLTNWLNYCWHNEPVSLTRFLFDFEGLPPPNGKLEWHAHMWFLISMCIYAVLTPLLVTLAISKPARAGLDWFNARTTGWTLWALALLVAAAVVALRAAHDVVLKPVVADTPFAWIALATMNYLPYFALGGLAMLDRRLFAALHRLSISGLLIAGGGYAAINLWGDLLPRALERTVYWTMRGMLILFIISALMWAFERWFNKPSPVLSFAVDAAFSFYIFHLGTVFAVALLLQPLGLSIHGTYAGILVLVPLFTLSLHAFIIKPVPALRFSPNGKRPARRPAPAHGPA
ncbi:acyltransferase family protein [Polymorphobacter multimanifer]|uniref:acyltransferase family protein n=1 Tax=Polymorphobacter multimanifer TaxID=1070431 RepID=UPI001664A051|nr:acyltransferase family protein [Polymorphobacter multimanifer]